MDIHTQLHLRPDGKPLLRSMLKAVRNMGGQFMFKIWNSMQLKQYFMIMVGGCSLNIIKVY